MRVIKVLNNSLVLALDNAGQESILMGKGIGFHKSIGYEFQESEIEKVFVLKDKEVSGISSVWRQRQTASSLSWPRR